MKKFSVIWILCCMLILSAGKSYAVTGGAVDSDSDVYAGVVVDYMGKVCFQVLEYKTYNPIPGASIEIYVDSVQRYVLLGQTDAQGEYEIDVAYSPNSSVYDAQFEMVGDTLTFTGAMLRLPTNELKYRIYKADWRPYPRYETVEITTKEFPMILTTYLYTKDKFPSYNGNGGDTTNKGKLLGAGAVKEPETEETTAAAYLPGDGEGIDTLPKTGVQGYMNLWLLGLGLFLFAIILILYLLKKEKKQKGEQ